MSDAAPRVNPRRPMPPGPDGLPRAEIGKRTAASEPAAEKPLRASGPFKRWHMVIAYASRGSIDDHTRQSLAAAAILAKSDTGVIALILGPLSDGASGDLSEVGADQVAILSDLSVQRFDPERALAAVLTLIKNYLPEHIFMPDNPRAEADLGRRLIAILGVSAATGVIELSKTHAAVRCGSVLARTPLPQVMLLAPGTTDTDLPFKGQGKVLDESVSG